MPGVPPKDPSKRLRRNKATTRSTLPATAPAVGMGAQRQTPTLQGSGSLEKSTREWWRIVWASPMASEWIATDVLGLTRLAYLLDLIAKGEGSAALMQEIRQQEDRFGLSPLARRRLEWQVPLEGADAKADPGPADDDGRYLRLVGAK